MSSVISTAGLVKNYGRVKALQGLDLTIEPGKIYGLLGPNGAGRSALIKTLVGASEEVRNSIWGQI